MKPYCVRFTGGEHGVNGMRDIECADEGDALIACHVIAVDFETAGAWDGDRLVCLVSRAGSSADRSCLETAGASSGP